MKNTQKLFALLISVMMLLSLVSVTAFAADPTGSITIENASENIEYNVYKILDITLDGSNVIYSIKSDSPWYDVIATEGADLFEVGDPDTNGVCNVVRKGDAEDDDILDLFKGHFTATAGEEEGDPYTWTSDITGISVADSKTPTADGELKFEGLAYGYYFITSNLGAQVTIDNVTTDVTVIDKNEKPHWDNPDDPDEPTVNYGKVIIENGDQVTENSVNYGEPVTYDIAVKAYNYDNGENITAYYIKDTIADGFALELTSGKFVPDYVTVNGTDVTDYDVDWDSADPNTFIITIPWATVTTDSGDPALITDIEQKYASSAVINIGYKATLDAEGDDVVVGKDGNTNTANFSYVTAKVGEEEPEDPDPDDPDDWSEDRTTYTYVYALAIQKVDDEGAALAGAVFTTDDFKAIKTAAGRYYYCEDDATDATNEFDTDANGVLIIKGLEEGEYTFSELTAPAGYNKLDGTFDITAELTSADTKTITAYYDADGNLTDTKVSDELTKTYLTDNELAIFGIPVQNHAGTVLPSTGGIGTTIFYILGSILLLGAAVLLITKQRMNAEN